MKNINNCKKMSKNQNKLIRKNKKYQNKFKTL